MNQFTENIRSVYPVSDEAIKLLFDSSRLMTFPKGATVISEGDANNKIYLLKEGFSRAFVNREGKDVTVWFSFPGEPLLMILGTISPAVSLVNVETLEESSVLVLERTEMERLFRQNLELCNWGRLLAEKYLLMLEEFVTIDLCIPASERYLRLMKNIPELLHKASLKHVASYLLITPESLSRIRSRIRNKKK